MYIHVYMLLRCFHSHDRILQMKLVYEFVHPTLEYNSSVWSPHLVKENKRVQNPSLRG